MGRSRRASQTDLVGCVPLPLLADTRFTFLLLGRSMLRTEVARPLPVCQDGSLQRMDGPIPEAAVRIYDLSVNKRLVSITVPCARCSRPWASEATTHQQGDG